MKLIEQLHAANLTYMDVVRLSDGRLTKNKLEKANSRLTDLTPEDAALVNQIIAAWKMAHAHVKFVVFSAVAGAKTAS